MTPSPKLRIGTAAEPCMTGSSERYTYIEPIQETEQIVVCPEVLLFTVDPTRNQ